MTLPRSPTEMAKPRDRLRFGLAAAWPGLAGRWRYPQPLSGDLESMGTRDIAYWLYKSSHPIRRAERGSGLEAFFKSQAGECSVEPPDGMAGQRELRISAAGDLMTHPFLAGSGAALYASVAELFRADLTLANLECVVAERGPGLELDLDSGPLLVMSPAELDAACTLGDRRFDFVTIANNHTLDLGPAGVDSTIAALRARGIAFHGANATDADALEPAIVERNGIRIGILAHTFGLNGKKPPRERPRIVNRTNLNDVAERVDLELFCAQLDACRRASVDFVVAQLHWGMEFEFSPRQSQVAFAHRIAELGVDLVLGHHPHVVQPVEFFRPSREPTRVVPIYYSLGNLINPFSADYFCRSGLADVTLVHGIVGGVRKTLVRRAALRLVDQAADLESRALRLAPAPA